jgi:sulfite reductase alpha subunit-like flavoprotein
LEEELHELGVESTHVVNFEEFKKETFGKHELVIVCVATHYEGDPCDNTLEFWKYLKALRKEGSKDAFKGMKFVIFGLGDTSYELFNEMGVEFDKRFEELGGERLYELGAANAEH